METDDDITEVMQMNW